MAGIGAFDRTKHFSELDVPLVSLEGVLSPSDRRARALSNLYGAGSLADPGIAGDVLFQDDMTVEGDLTVDGAITHSGVTTQGGVIQSAVVVPDGASYAVLAANTGKVHLIPDQTATVTLTLPAAAAGLHYEFRHVGGAADAQNWVIVPTAGFFIGGLLHTDVGGTTAAVYSNGSSNDVLTIVTPAAGTQIFVTSNGTNWYVSGVDSSATIATFADA